MGNIKTNDITFMCIIHNFCTTRLINAAVAVKLLNPIVQAHSYVTVLTVCNKEQN